MKKVWPFVIAGLALAGPAARADVWDLALNNDDFGPSTQNELIHGTSQTHDLGARPGPIADLDFYTIGIKPWSSYEILLDSTTGDVGLGQSLLFRTDFTGDVVWQAAAFTTPSLAYSSSLRFANTGAMDIDDQRIRVGPGACGTNCSVNDQYHIRMQETTISVARFNNAGSQVSVLMIQNTTNLPVTGAAFYWSATGTLLGSSVLNLSAKALEVRALTSIPALVGQGGSITIAHDAPYGGLNVKAVALEPATGYSFDTAGVYIGN